MNFEYLDEYFDPQNPIGKELCERLEKIPQFPFAAYTDTPLTEEMLYYVRELNKQEGGCYDTLILVNHFVIPCEAKDLIAMYFSCKKNGWDDQAYRVLMKFKDLFSEDPDLFSNEPDFPFFKAAFDKEVAAEKAAMEEHERELRERERNEKEQFKKNAKEFFIAIILSLVLLLVLLGLGYLFDL